MREGGSEQERHHQFFQQFTERQLGTRHCTGIKMKGTLLLPSRSSCRRRGETGGETDHGHMSRVRAMMETEDGCIPNMSRADS